MTPGERARLDALARHSIHVIRANQAETGAYVASPTFPVYRYSWFRDGAFIADAMSRAGHPDSAERFFGWCAGVVSARRGAIEALLHRHAAGAPIAPYEFLHARYTVEGGESPEEWWTFQLDGYGLWLWALDEHARRHASDLRPYREAIALSVRYLAAFWNEPCYDWWEEHVGHRHTSTLASVHAGLRAAAGFAGLPAAIRREATAAAETIRRRVLQRAVRNGRLTKWLDGDGLDASLIACATPLGLLAPDDPLVAGTVLALEATLAHGGVHRNLDDTYYGGGEWLLLAALLGWHYAEVGRTDDARRQLRWIADQATPGGDLPEQVSRHLLHPDARQDWVERWGPIATPLVWSHAMFVTLALVLDVVAAPVPPEPFAPALPERLAGTPS